MKIRVPETINLNENDFIDVELQNYGPDAAPGGGDDAVSRIRLNSSRLLSGEWASIDIPLSDFTSLSSRTNLRLLLFDSSTNITAILVDNIYFYKE